MEPIKKIDSLVERSEEVQEILGTPPQWPILWGSTIIFVAILVLLFLSWIIQYPDELQAKILVTTTIPPHGVVARSNGKIAILTPENERVRKNDVLCILDNPANHDDVFLLSAQLDSIGNDFTRLTDVSISDHLSVGEIQQEYNDFVAGVNKLLFFDTYTPIEKEIISIKIQIKKNHQLLRQQSKQKNIFEKQLGLVQLDYDRDKKLFDEKVIATKALEEKEQLLLIASVNDETAEANLTATQIRLAELEKELQDKNIQNALAKNDLILRLRECGQNLRSAIALWEQEYILRSPIDGRVSFFNYWTNDQFVKEGDEVMIIVPEGPQAVIGKVRMPVQNSGKVKVGQRVNIQLDNYPYAEYGMIRGRIKNISLVPRENLYAIDVELPENLTTTYQKRLEFKHEMRGSAEIITEELRLLERMFYEIRKIFVS